MVRKKSLLSRLQEIEFYLADFTRKILGSNQRCVPGCAGIYERHSLLEALEKHTGELEGDDFELTTKYFLKEIFKLKLSKRSITYGSEIFSAISLFKNERNDSKNLELIGLFPFYYLAITITSRTRAYAENIRNLKEYFSI